MWITGILLTRYIPGITVYASWLLLPASGGMLYYYWFPLRRTYALRWVWGAGFSFIFCFLAMLDTDLQYRASEWPFCGKTYSLEGIVQDRPRPKAATDEFPFLIRSVSDGKEVWPLTRNVRVYMARDTSASRILPGSRLRLEGTVYSADTDYLRIKGVSATVYVPPGRWSVDTEADDAPVSFLHRALRWKYALTERYGRLRVSSEERAVLKALTLGDTGDMDKTLRRRFSLAGVSHLLSVSGFHVAAVCGFIALCFSFFPGYGGFGRVRFVLLLSAVWVFAAMTGLSAPAVRAALMLTLFLAGGLLGYRTDRYNILAAAAFCMLLYNPLYLFDVGFQLSYIAVFSILYLQPRISGIWEVRNPLLRKPWNLLAVTLAAQIGTFPVCLFVFGEVSSVFVFTNLPLAVLAAVLIPVSLFWASCLAYWPVFDSFRIVPETLLHWMYAVVDRFGSLTHASVSVPFTYAGMMLCYGVLVSYLLYRKEREPKWFLLSLGLLLIMFLLSVRWENILRGC